MSNDKRNYLRMYRRRFGLSQADVAFLLRLKGGSQVSRFERKVRVPSLELVFALEQIFSVSASELFKGLHASVGQQTAERIRALVDQLSRGGPTVENLRKVETLRVINSTGRGGAYGQ